jgi:hypothetical protein
MLLALAFLSLALVAVPLATGAEQAPKVYTVIGSVTRILVSVVHVFRRP